MLSKVAFVGIHTGHLGFYADWLPHEVEKLIIEINNSEFQVIEYPLLELIVRYNDNGYETRYLALNEATMKTENGSTLVVDVNIRGKHFERFRGDGLCISTPSGSTAYNKALGGALIHPSLEAMQIAEIASINNRVFRTVGSPLVLPKHHTCLITPVNHDTIRTTIDHVSIKHKTSMQYSIELLMRKCVLPDSVHFRFGKGYMTHLFLVMMNDDFNISNCTVRTSENFLKNQDYSKRTLSAIKLNGALLLNGSPVTVRQVMDKGDRLEVHFPSETPSENLIPYDKELEVIYEDAYLIIVNKPQMQNCAPSREHPHGSLVEQVLAYYTKKAKK